MRVNINTHLPLAAPESCNGSHILTWKDTSHYYSSFIKINFTKTYEPTRSVGSHHIFKVYISLLPTNVVY